jgi:hypothetical protein
MASIVFQPSTVRDEPNINLCRATQAVKTCAPRADNGDQGDVIIRGLWERGADCILEVSIAYTDAVSYKLTEPSKVLEAV